MDGAGLLLIRPLLLIVAIAFSWNQFVATFDPGIKMEVRHLIPATIATSVALAAIALAYRQHGPLLGSLISIPGLLAAVLRYSHHRTEPASSVAATGFLLAYIWTGKG
ncbi:MAG: hypothetical protein KJ947_24615 [Alphaproteobacteria bacterium]|jgi:hypothetical protein|nr:hypothetical protein [Alphaproteobacteria bacterium]MBU1552736.1 hypothetical protein [Alphaproteobacteria bacterium]MBU2387260.1 hypothetical protein [Alphaproteobacteria bacterium]|tara:strand:+ start:200 stop:523 length:324 start_codon:yes stop_codon:yes gene_type:complete